ncbi:MAG: NgoPII family restriction endonuclease [Calothrix sp. MO_167.B42]|nr:NgoPII family restriction endonuclease [Calothrix sp. MO_167.B42]
MANILTAIKIIINNPITDLVNFYKSQSQNKINSVGDSLEYFIKDIFADTLSENDLNEKNKKYSEVFSYIGNLNNPPDIILQNSDAIEVKKIESLTADIALNSSYPKSKLYADNPMLTKACRECESWQEKDIIYAIGVSKNSKLKILWLIYGDCYAADKEIYERITNTISYGIKQIKDVEFSKTRELGRVNKVDPLGITYLRIRGMWGINNPTSVYDYIFQRQETSNLQIVALMRKEKYLSFPQTHIHELENLTEKNLNIRDVNIKDPNNPAKLIAAKMINYYR